MEKQHVFIVGSKGIPAEYGGFETFVDNISQQMKFNIMLHVFLTETMSSCTRGQEYSM